MIIGLTTHSVDELNEAIAGGADYVGIGPVFSTETKPSLTPAGIGYITEALKVLEGTGVGHAAIGGISIDNVDAVIGAGVKTIAVCSAVTKAADPAEMCRLIKGKQLL